MQPALANRLRSLARAKSVTLFALLLGQELFVVHFGSCCRISHLRGLFALALSRLAAAQDLAIASPVGHRQGTAIFLKRTTEGMILI